MECNAEVPVDSPIPPEKALDGLGLFLKRGKSSRIFDRTRNTQDKLSLL